METSLTIDYDKQWPNCVSAIGPQSLKFVNVDVSIVFKGRGKLFLSHNSTSWLSFRSDLSAVLSLNLTISIKMRLYLGLIFLHQHGAPVLIKQVFDILVSIQFSHQTLCRSQILALGIFLPEHRKYCTKISWKKKSYHHVTSVKTI